MTLWHGNTFLITGPLCGEPLVTGGLPSYRASKAGLWCFLCFQPRQITEQTVWWLVIWNRMIVVWCHCNVHCSSSVHQISIVWCCQLTLVCYTREVNPSLTGPPLKLSGCLAKFGLTLLVLLIDPVLRLRFVGPGVRFTKIPFVIISIMNVSGDTKAMC